MNMSKAAYVISTDSLRGVLTVNLQEYEFTPETGRPVAKVLEIVALTDIYHKAASMGAGMCLALCRACQHRIITDAEYAQADRAIVAYMLELGGQARKGYPPYLWQRLRIWGLPHTPDDLAALYLDWDNRPRPRQNKAP